MRDFRKWTPAALCFRRERELVDVNTGERVVLSSGGGNSLFFVPMEYWAAIFLVLGVVFLFIK
jgi:hypothetical protein